MARIAQGTRGRQARRGVARLIELEASRGQSCVTRLGELDAVEGEERLRHRMEAERIAFLHHQADGLAPYFDDVGFGHGWISRSH
jgi:hypothetical protein